MEPLFAILLLGCGHNADTCEPVQREAMTFASASDCESALDAAMDDAARLDFPEVVVECRPVQKIPAALPVVGENSRKLEIATRN